VFDILEGDALTVLKTLESESVNCCVTSPPYYGLRDYGTAKWEGGSPECDHRAPDEAGKTQKPTAGQREHPGRWIGSLCYKCGATRIDSQVGLESTPDAYVSRLVEVFREVRRVLKKNGTCWLNLGDSYAGSWGNQGRKETRGTQRPINGPMIQNLKPYPNKQSNTGKIAEGLGLKRKDLIGIPWRVAFALQADGWWLRQDIIWHKSNPMTESVKDRCTKAHDYVFLLTKSARYWWDAEAVKEPASDNAHSRTRKLRAAEGQKTFPTNERNGIRPPGCGPKSSKAGSGVRYNDSFSAIVTQVLPFRNLRSVWKLATQPFPGAHFATFPPRLAELCIQAGCPEDGVVLDPFSGAASTGIACINAGRDYLGIELKPEYIDMSWARLMKHLEKRVNGDGKLR
jgi:DNA modification methylase